LDCLDFYIDASINIIIMIQIFKCTNVGIGCLDFSQIANKLNYFNNRNYIIIYRSVLQICLVCIRACFEINTSQNKTSFGHLSLNINFHVNNL